MKPINEYDIVFMSYDEPNADKNYADLLTKAPWAKRVHGVKGFDACHKAAAREAQTERFITVDADNIVRDDFFGVTIDEALIGKSTVVSWSGKNHVNGLVYGNGGIKLWPKHVVEQMRTHEAAEDETSKTDFCWDINYKQMNNIYSDVFTNASAYQAYRAGFREGVKLGLDRGESIANLSRFKESIDLSNYKRLLVWSSVGADVDNGLWSIYGTRLGLFLTNLDRHNWDFTAVRDYEWHLDYWVREIQPKFLGDSGLCIATGWRYNKARLLTEIKRLGFGLKNKMDMPMADLDSNASKLFKETYVNPPRTSPLVTQEQITTV